MVQIMYTHVCKCKNYTFETAQGIGEGGGEGEQWKG
jgi:hypothetical protein